jgi:hypothetical protein
MPAFCGSCGLVFPSGIVIENSTGISLSGVNARCPRCGGVGRVPDGLYNVLGQTVQLLTGPGRSSEQLLRLKSTLEAARNQQQEPEEVRKAVLAAAPELTGLASAMPTTRTELYAFITVVLTLLALLVSAYAAFKPSGPSQSEIDAMVQRALAGSLPPSPPTAQQPKKQKKSKVGRNEHCPCGSGKKFKKCCLGAAA